MKVSILLVSVSLGGLLGCGGSGSAPSAAATPPSPSSPSANCTFVLTVSEDTINASGGTASASVTTGPQCRWSANAGNTPWITMAPTAFTGSGAVPMIVDPNRSFTGRAAVVQVIDDAAEVEASQTVTQRSAACLYSVEPATLSFEWLGTSDGSDIGRERIRVHAEPSDCRWTATPAVQWMQFVGSSPRGGTGDGFVDISVGFNAGAARVGELVIAGLSGLNPDARVVVTQAAR